MVSVYKSSIIIPDAELPRIGSLLNCLYCGDILKKGKNGNRSSEHIIKKSILKSLGHLNTKVNLILHSHEIGELEKRKPTFDGLRNDFVCVSCNSGWIRMEDETIEDIIVELAHGGSLIATEAQKKSIARWILRTAISMLFAFKNFGAVLPISLPRMMKEAGFLPRGFFSFYVTMPKAAEAALSSMGMWPHVPENLLTRNTVLQKFAVQLNEVVFGCAFTSIADPIFCLQPYMETLVIREAILLSRNLSMDDFQEILPLNFSRAIVNIISLETILLGGRNRFVVEKWP